MNSVILAINPGGGSTKVGLYELLEDGTTKALWSVNLRHPYQELQAFRGTLEQLSYRKELISGALKSKADSSGPLAAVVGRGGPLKPLPGGVYRVTAAMIEDIQSGNVQADHPSLLGALLAYELAEPLAIPSFIVDPVCTDEMNEEARVSGFPGIERRSLTHALNIKAMCRNAARALKLPAGAVNLVAVHLGSGISVVAYRQGRMIDLNDSSGEGPFGTQRAGGLPIRELLHWMQKQSISATEMESLLLKKSGLAAYTGSDEFTTLLSRYEQDDHDAIVLYRALLLQLKKEIGAYAAVLDGAVQAIVIGGGMANSERLIADLTAGVSWIAPVLVFPGEDELLALADGAARTLCGLEPVLDYAHGG